MPFKTNALARVGYLACMLLLFNCSLFAQKTVTGRIINNADKQPISGATIQVKGTKVATQTGADGSFSINVPQDNNVLLISVIGYQNLQLPVSGRSAIGDIALTMAVTSLNEIVVTGYAVQRKKDLTGAVSVVDLADAKKQPVPDVVNMLQGQASGVSVVSSGQPGQSPVIRIRGFNSFGNNTPLYVVDGVPTQNVSDLNTNDVSSIQVLKDAGAASIYGARASNGVIIITTRKGAGKVKVSYDGYYGRQVPKGGNVWHILNPTEGGQLLYQAQQNYNTLKKPTDPVQALGSPIYGSGATPVVPDFLVSGTAGGVTNTGGFAAGSAAVDPSLYNFDLTGANNYLIARANKGGTDWYHEIFKAAPIQQHNISVSGGNDQGSYLFSLNYFNQQGTLINTYLKRYTIRSNVTYKLGSKIRIGENLAYSAIQNPQALSGILVEGSAIGMAMRENSIIPVYDIFGNYSGTAPKGLNNPRNPVALQRNTRNDRGLAGRLFGNVYGEVDLMKNLTFRTSFGGEYYTGWSHSFNTPDYYNFEPQFKSPSYTETSYTGNDWTWTNTLSYNWIKGDHNLKLVGGMESYQFINHNLGGTTLGSFSIDPNYVNLSTGSGTTTNYSNSNPQINYSPSTTGYKAPIGSGESLVSYFARADYTFKEKYLLGATFRRDGSSKFITHRWGNFYAVSAGWRISQESFLQDAKWITDLKIRGSYGVMGNQFNALGTNSYFLYGSNKQTTYYDISGSGSLGYGLSQSQIGNPNAKWEQDGNANVGFDLTILGGKLTISADWYNKSIKDLLYQITLPGTQGAATVPAYNVGRMKNSGVDLMVSGQTNITRDLKFVGTVTFTTVSNKILQIDANGSQYFDLDGRRFNGSNIIRNAVGHPVSAFYGYKVIGFWNSQAEIDAADLAASKASNGSVTTYQNAEGVGRFRYADVSKQGWIDNNSKTFLGNPSPKFTYGLNLGLDYKNFDFSMFLYGVYGNDVWNNIKWWTDFYASFPGAASSKTALYDSWTPTKHNAKAPVQDAVNGSNASTNTVPNSYFVEKGSYLRAKNVTLGYTFGGNGLTKVGISKIRAYLQAANLFTITKYSGIDPEISVNGMNGQNSATDFGIDEGAYANPRQYLLGLQITF